MTDSMVYDYEHRLVTPDDAKNILGGGLPKDNPHHADDACLIWEPVRLVYDSDGRLLLGTDELRHIAASGILLDAAVYREPADREYVTPVVAAPRTETKPEEPVKPEPEPKPKKPEPVPEPEAKRTAEAPRPHRRANRSSSCCARSTRRRPTRSAGRACPSRWPDRTPPTGTWSAP